MLVRPPVGSVPFVSAAGAATIYILQCPRAPDRRASGIVQASGSALDTHHVGRQLLEVPFASFCSSLHPLREASLTASLPRKRLARPRNQLWPRPRPPISACKRTARQSACAEHKQHLLCTTQRIRGVFNFIFFIIVLFYIFFCFSLIYTTSTPGPQVYSTARNQHRPATSARDSSHRSPGSARSPRPPPAPHRCATGPAQTCCARP